MYVYYDEDNNPGTTSDRISTTAINVTQAIRIRGVTATKGMDYFRSITPSDGTDRPLRRSARAEQYFVWPEWCRRYRKQLIRWSRHRPAFR